jgi:hypothetical protein
VGVVEASVVELPKNVETPTKIPELDELELSEVAVAVAVASVVELVGVRMVLGSRPVEPRSIESPSESAEVLEAVLEAVVEAADPVVMEETRPRALEDWAAAEEEASSLLVAAAADPVVTEEARPRALDD